MSAPGHPRNSAPRDTGGPDGSARPETGPSRHDQQPPPTPAPRAGYLVAGTVSVVVAAVLIVAGAFALWGESKKDADGYLSTGTERFTTTSRALASERLDVEIDGKHWLAGVEDLGDTRLKVAPAVGQARVRRRR